MITKYVKFDYFQVTCRPKGAPASVRDVPFDLRTIISKWDSLDLPGRTVAYKQEKARLESYGFDVSSGYLWDMYFSRLRDFNLPTRAKEDAPSEPFDLDDDEYIGENVSAIYDDVNHIIMIQRNKFSLGPAAIEEYVNYFAEPGEEINFKPIAIPNPTRKFNSAEFVRKVRIKLADIDKAKVEREKPSLKKWLDLLSEYEPINAEIILSVGRKKDATLGGNLREFVEEILQSKDLVSKAEVSIKKDELAEIEVVDLFEEFAHDIASFTVPPRTILNHEAVVYQMKQLYEKRRAQFAGLLYS